MATACWSLKTQSCMFRQRQHLRLDTITKPQQATVWCHFILKTQSGNGACLDRVSFWDLITSHRKLWLGTTAFWKQSLTPDSVTAWDLMPNHPKLWPVFSTLITKHSRATPVATAFWTVNHQVLNHDYQTPVLCLLHSIFKLFGVKPSTMITRDNSPVDEGEDGHQEVNKGTRQLTCWWGGRWTPGGKQRDKTTHLLMRGKMDTRR